jgi:transposase
MKAAEKTTLEKSKNERFCKESVPVKSLEEIMLGIDVEKEIAQLLSIVDAKDTLIESQQCQIKNLQNELLILRRKLFGRKSERYISEDPNQLKLDFGGVEVLPEEEQVRLEAIKETITCQRKKRKENPTHPVRQPLPADLERREEIIEPDPIPEGSKCMGEEVTEILEYTPGTFHVRRIVRRKYALAEEAGAVIGELPALPLPGSNAGASLLSHLSVSKYRDHLPFYRQIEMFKRQGITLAQAPSTAGFPLP